MPVHDIHYTYEEIQKELNTGSTDKHKIILKELHRKKLVCRWIPHDLTEYQTEKSVRTYKETLLVISDGEHRLISIGITGDKNVQITF